MQKVRLKARTTTLFKCAMQSDMPDVHQYLATKLQIPLPHNVPQNLDAESYAESPVQCIFKPDRLANARNDHCMP